jgi:chromosome partitioning protein
MISLAGPDNLHKIVVLNPKGGSGKTTLATNLASVYASRGPPPTLIDFDPQGFCLRWLDKRPKHRPAIHGIQACSEPSNPMDTPVPQVPADSSIAILDLPAGVPHTQLHHFTYLADSILLPIMPSEIDVHSATLFIAELLLDAQLDRRQQKLAIVATRVRSNTKSYQMLLRFLTSLRIPLIAVLRDSQNFVYCTAQGIGICELPVHRAKDDLGALGAIVRWLDRRRAVTAAQRQAMIAKVAYEHAEHRGFQGGDPGQDWLDAEHEVDALLGREGELEPSVAKS